MKFLRMLSCLVLSLMLTLSLTACAKKECVYAGVRYNEDRTPECYLFKYTNLTESDQRLNFFVQYTMTLNGRFINESVTLFESEYFWLENLPEDFSADEIRDAESYTLKPNETITLKFRPFEISPALFFSVQTVYFNAWRGTESIFGQSFDLPAVSTEQDFWDKLLPEYRPTDTPSVSIG